MINYKELKAKDWREFKKLRLEALQECPDNFASSFEEEVKNTEEKLIKILDDNYIIGAFDHDDLIAMVAFYKLNLRKIEHKGIIWGLYLKKTYRSNGIASELLNEIIKHARSNVLQVQLSVNTKNIKAINLYKKHGFIIYGTELESIKIGNNFHDEYLMYLKLKK